MGAMTHRIDGCCGYIICIAHIEGIAHIDTRHGGIAILVPVTAPYPKQVHILQLYIQLGLKIIF